MTKQQLIEQLNLIYRNMHVEDQEEEALSTAIRLIEQMSDESLEQFEAQMEAASKRA